MPSTTTARPNKTVHSYEQMLLELANKQLIWRYGLKADDSGSYGIVADARYGECQRYTTEHRDTGKKDLSRHTIALYATWIGFVNTK